MYHQQRIDWNALLESVDQMFPPAKPVTNPEPRSAVFVKSGQIIEVIRLTGCVRCRNRYQIRRSFRLLELNPDDGLSRCASP